MLYSLKIKYPKQAPVLTERLQPLPLRQLKPQLRQPRYECSEETTNADR